MSFDSRLIHTLVVKRMTPTTEPSTLDEYGQPVTAETTVATVPGLIQPKSAREVAQLNEAGAVLSTHTAFLRPTDITPADRIRIAAGGMAGTYQIDGIRNAAGLGHHLEIDCRMVAA